MNWRTPATAASLVFCISGLSFAQDRIDILYIWHNFIASGAAATDCDRIQSGFQQGFLANFTDVSIRAFQALQQREPAVPKAQIVIRMKAAEAVIRDTVDAEVKQNSCSSPKIQQLLAMYKAHSEMHF